MACAGSTENAALAASGMEIDPFLAYRMSPSVALRREPFGALSYHYGTRRLTFLRSRELTELVERLAEFPSLAAALDGVAVPEERRSQLLLALSSLLVSGIICAG